jgi:transcription elongation factor GreB
MPENNVRPVWKGAAPLHNAGKLKRIAPSQGCVCYCKKMSRAFVRESDDAREQARPARSPLPPGVTNYITPDGAKKMQAELDGLIQQKRSCQSEDEKGKLEAQLRDVQLRAQTLVISPPPVSLETVSFGTTVTVRDSDGEETTYRIVGIEEVDLERDWISWRSPLARALVSHRVADKVQFNAPSGTRYLEILRISFP